MKSWFSNSIIYHIFIDRFAGYRYDADASRPEFCGGNIKGIIGKIRYIRNLGANTIWISPFYQTSAYHGYHITNFDKIDERFGTLDELKELINICRENNLKIIADIVPNHCSSKHPWFIDAVKNRDSQYYNWFYFEKWPHSYLRFLEFNDLPKINLENPETARYMIDSLLKWATLGFNGFRIDHILGLPDSFLINLRKELLNINKEFVLIGEAWSEGMKYKYLKTLRLKGKTKHWKNGFKQTDIQKAYDGIIDGVLDFGWRELVFDSLKTIKNDKKKSKLLLGKCNSQYSKDFFLPRFLDNHDTNRIMFLCKNKPYIFKICLRVLFSQNQPIVIYYGTEYGLTHKQNVSPEVGYSDLQARGLMPWTEEAKYYNYIANLLKNRLTDK